jgi:hypothetical protein
MLQKRGSLSDLVLVKRELDLLILMAADKMGSTENR